MWENDNLEPQQHGWWHCRLSWTCDTAGYHEHVTLLVIMNMWHCRLSWTWKAVLNSVIHLIICVHVTWAHHIYSIWALTRFIKTWMCHIHVLNAVQQPMCPTVFGKQPFLTQTNGTSSSCCVLKLFKPQKKRSQWWDSRNLHSSSIQVYWHICIYIALWKCVAWSWSSYKW